MRKTVLIGGMTLAALLVVFICIDQRRATTRPPEPPVPSSSRTDHTSGVPAAPVPIAIGAAAADASRPDLRPTHEADGRRSLSREPAPRSAASRLVIRIDSALPMYVRLSPVSGKLNSVGSDSLNNLLNLWAEAFRQIYPNVTITIEGKGSSTAPPALIAGTAQLGPMSRKMKAEEIDAFEKKYAYKPRMVAVAIDTLAVYVNKDNPLLSLSLQQVDSIFSSTRKRGGSDIATWGELGLVREWTTRPISLYGRNSASDTYGFFKEHALKNGDFRSSVQEQSGSASVAQGVEQEIGGIGYSAIGDKPIGVRAVPLLDCGVVLEPSPENVQSFRYPITRYIYIYINVNPATGPDPLVREFIRFVLSASGQRITVEAGYFPLLAKTAAEFLESSGCK